MVARDFVCRDRHFTCIVVNDEPTRNHVPKLRQQGWRDRQIPNTCLWQLWTGSCSMATAIPAAEGGRNGDEVAARRRSLHTELAVRFSPKMTERIANRSGQKCPFRTANRFQQKNSSFMHGKGCFAGGVDTFRGAYLARHATPWPKFSGELRGPGLRAPAFQNRFRMPGQPP